MFSFAISVVALFVGYMIYGRVAERVFGPDDRETPAIRKADHVDYIVLPSWRIFMIQFLNIAGTGPIFGAIMGMWFGPAAYLWIVLGCIFGGAVHDYISGMLSLRHDGSGLAELTGFYLGSTARKALIFFTMLMMVLVGAFFVYCPAIILSGIWGRQDDVGGNYFPLLRSHDDDAGGQGDWQNLPCLRALYAVHGHSHWCHAVMETAGTTRDMGRTG